MWGGGGVGWVVVGVGGGSCGVDCVDVGPMCVFVCVCLGGAGWVGLRTHARGNSRATIRVSPERSARAFVCLFVRAEKGRGRKDVGGCVRDDTHPCTAAVLWDGSDKVWRTGGLGTDATAAPVSVARLVRLCVCERFGIVCIRVVGLPKRGGSLRARGAGARAIELMIIEMGG